MEQTFENIENKPKSKRGGKRNGSGRKPLLDKKILEQIKERMKAHGAEQVLVEGIEKKKMKMTRAEALLEVLYKEGLKGNIQAIKEYFDRIMGKAVQPIEGVKEGEAITIDFVGEAKKRSKHYL